MWVVISQVRNEVDGETSKPVTRKFPHEWQADIYEKNMLKGVENNPNISMNTMKFEEEIYENNQSE